MKKLEKLKLKVNAKILEKKEMIKILGGGSNICIDDGMMCYITASSLEECNMFCKQYYGPNAYCI